MQKEIPIFLQKMLLNDYGEELTKQIIEGYISKRKVTLRANTIKIGIEELKLCLQDNKIDYEEVKWYKDALIIKNIKEDQIKSLDLYEDGKVYLQNLSSMIPPVVLEPCQNDNILDMAAAPGGKTTQIVAMTNNECMITACERNKIRAEKLKYNLNKQGATRVNVMMQDARELDSFFSFDKILLDSPCSGSGTDNVFEKNFTEELIRKSVMIQEKMIKKAIEILKPGGEMVYSTCSILKQENEEIIRKILKSSKIEIIPIENENFREIPLLPTLIRDTMCIMPNEYYEGFFIAKLRKIK